MRYNIIIENTILNELTRPRTLTLDSFLKQKGFEVIGKGSFSSVYENPKFDYILKVFSEKDTGYILHF